MEILVESVDDSLISDDVLLSVRFGGVRRQVPMSKALRTPLCFPTLLSRKDPRNVKFDILSQQGSGWLMLRPGEEQFKVPLLGCGGTKSMMVRVAPSKADGAGGNEQSAERPCTALGGAERGDGGTPSTRPCTADGGTPILQGTLGGLGACNVEEAAEAGENDAAGCSEKRRDRAQNAKEYLEFHQVITFIHALLHAILKERPADPFAFMAQHMPKCGAASPAKDLLTAESGAKAEPLAPIAEPAPDAPAPEAPAPPQAPPTPKAAPPPEAPPPLEPLKARDEEPAELPPHQHRARAPRPTMLCAVSPEAEALEELRLNCAVLKLQVQELQRENDRLTEQLERAGDVHVGGRGLKEGALAVDDSVVEPQPSAIVRCLSPTNVRRSVRGNSMASVLAAGGDHQLSRSMASIRRRPTLIRDASEKIKRIRDEDEEEEDEEEAPPDYPGNALQVRARSELAKRLSIRNAPGGAMPSYISKNLNKFWSRLRGEADSSDEYRVLRQSVFTGRWTLYSAGGKNKKPHQYNYSRRTPHLLEVPRCEGRCPFCVGNESNTPPPVLFFDKEGQMHDGVEGTELTPGWLCRVIPNIFPLLVTPSGLYGDVFQNKLAQIPHSAAARGEHSNEVLFAKPQDPHNKDCLEATTHRQVNAIGYSEVVIENPAHNGLLAIVDWHQVFLSLRALQTRGRVLANQEKVRQLLYFKQYGANSGGSLVHPHMQVVTLPLLTPETQNRLERAVEFHHRFGKCSVCHCLIEEPLREDGHACSRLIHQSKHFLVMVPFASNQYRITIVPRNHRPSWLSIPLEELEDLADVLQLVMESLFHALNDPEYNVYFHSIDRDEEVFDAAAVHWVLEVHPRFPAEMGGVELASGIRVISGLPEDWAQEFRGHVQKRLQVRKRRSKSHNSLLVRTSEHAAKDAEGWQRAVST